MLNIVLIRKVKTPYQCLADLMILDIEKNEEIYAIDQSIDSAKSTLIFSCKTLEDAERTKKINGETCIPEGTYKISLMNDATPMNMKYRVMFNDRHKGMLMLDGVPNFKQVYIHIGNYISDTRGCILVGSKYNASDIDTNQMIVNSRRTYECLYDVVVRRLLNNETVLLTVKSAEI